MRVTLDGRQIAANVGSVAEAVEKVRVLTQTSGRVVTEVLRDGAVFDPFVEEGEATAGGGKEITFTTQPIAEVVACAYKDAEETLAELAALQGQTADKLLSGVSAEAAGMLDGVLAHWDQIQQCVATGCALMGGAASEDEQCVENAVKNLLAKLSALKSAVQASDWVTVSDLLGYDFGPLTEEWRGLLHTLHATAERAGQSGAKRAG